MARKTKTKPEPELIACRFCGHDGDGVQYALGPIVAGSSQCQVACLLCGTHGPVGESMDAARLLWNMPTDGHRALKAAQRAARMLRAG